MIHLRLPRLAPRACRALAVLASFGAFACSGGGGGGDGEANPNPPPSLEASRQFRAIAGVSMGAYGAMNLGTKHRDLFGTIASLGGPVDMQQLIRDSVEDNLEVKAEAAIAREVGEDFTFDHLAPYPDRDTRVTMFHDLVIAFGNPFLHHPDTARLYLASDSEPAAIRTDDTLGDFEILPEPRGFLDGGDANEDGLRQSGETPEVPADVALLAVGSLAAIAPGATPTAVGGRALADLDGDGVFDVGDAIVINLAEPFTDGNANFVFEPDLGETSTDLGLDGVAGTGDFGEGNAAFDYDPDRATWLAEDPLSRVAAESAAEISEQRIYMDVGTEDEFEFAAHYEHFVAALQSKGLAVEIEEAFESNCADLPDPSAQFFLLRYGAGHIWVDSVDPEDLFDGNVCGDDTVWQRILSMIGFLNQSFPDGFFGTGDDFELPDIDLEDPDIDFPDLDVTGEVISADVPSPALSTVGGDPLRTVVVYRPPAFFHSDASFPVVYFLGGYGQEPEDFVRIGVLLDALILTGQLQNMFFVFVPGDGGRQGSFYVNHVVPHAQVPEIENPTSGRYEDSLLEDLIPAIERELLLQRVRF